MAESSFVHYYRCYPISLSGQHHLENGDKILMPLSALGLLSYMNIEYPMLFELINPNTRKISHCGVMEFSAEEGQVFLPGWLMRNLALEEGDLIIVKNAFLKRATFVKFRPHETALLEVSDPKAVLERTLRGFSCLTAGDTIVIEYNDRKFSLDVLETKPDEKAVSIIETDCEVDFAPALDYKEPEKPAVPVLVPVPVKERMKDGGKEEKEEVKFRPFVGVGRRLDGRSSSNGESIKEVSTTSLVRNGAVEDFDCCDQRIQSNGTCGSIIAGKPVFGSAEAVKNLEEYKKVKEDKKESKIQEEKKGFQPFSGKSYKLSGSSMVLNRKRT